VLPPNGFDNMDWGYLAEVPQIVWKTNGVDSEGRISFRVGLASIQVAGVKSEVLRQRWTELPWTIALVTYDSAKFGPKMIKIQPGSGDLSMHPSMRGLEVCFGVNTRGCDFAASKAIASPALKVKAACAFERGADSKAVFVVSTQGKRPSLVVVWGSGGSGGMSSWLEIRPLTDTAEQCKGLDG
jgi:hypothetical protein